MSRNKKQLDKESMFKKIMPSTAEGDQAVASPREFSAPVPPPLAAFPADIAPAAVKPATQTSFSAAPVTAVPLAAMPDTFAPLVSQPGTATIFSQEQRPSVPPVQATPQLVNLARVALEERLPAALEKFNCCDCDQCCLDVLAIALNKTKPEYAIINEGEVPASLITPELSRDAMTSLVQAIMLVKAHPRH